MDTLTHTLLGINMANAGLSRRTGRGTALVLAVASNLPDMDFLWSFFDQRNSFLFRRMLTHSLLGAPLLAGLAALLFRWRYRHIPWRTMFGLFLLGMGAHIVFDLINSYGVVLLYPVTLKRFELAWVFIIDPVLSGMLLAPLLLWAFVPWVRSRFVPLSRMSLACVAVYVISCGLGRSVAAFQLKKIVREQNLRPAFSCVFPEALGAHRFRGVLKIGNEYRVYLLHVLSGRYELKETFFTEEDRLEVQSVRATKAGKQFEWFFKAPVWRVLEDSMKTPHASSRSATETVSALGSEVEVRDLRFHSVVLPWRNPPFVFRFRNGVPVRRG